MYTNLPQLVRQLCSFLPMGIPEIERTVGVSSLKSFTDQRLGGARKGGFTRPCFCRARNRRRLAMSLSRKSTTTMDSKMTKVHRRRRQLGRAIAENISSSFFSLPSWVGKRGLSEYRESQEWDNKIEGGCLYTICSLAYSFIHQVSHLKSFLRKYMHMHKST